MQNTEIPSPCVYFVRCPQANLIKIGTSTNLESRLIALRSIGFEMELIGVIDGGHKKETRLHKQFRSSRQVGEWFSSSSELMEFIENNSLPFDPAQFRQKRRDPLSFRNIPGKRAVAFLVPPELVDIINRRAKETGRSRSETVALILCKGFGIEPEWVPTPIKLRIASAASA